jgi:hypothetical protein
MLFLRDHGLVKGPWLMSRATSIRQHKRYRRGYEGPDRAPRHSSGSCLGITQEADLAEKKNHCDWVDFFAEAGCPNSFYRHRTWMTMLSPEVQVPLLEHDPSPYATHHKDGVKQTTSPFVQELKSLLWAN